MARAKRPRSKLSRTRTGRYTAIGIGVLLLIAAPIIGPPAPGPLGIVMIAAGLTLILRNSTSARRRYVRFKRRHPKTGKWFDRGLRRYRPDRKAPGEDNAKVLGSAPSRS